MSSIMSRVKESVKDSISRIQSSSSSASSSNTAPKTLDDAGIVSAGLPQPDGPPVTIAVIGAGQRGKRYASYAFLRPDLCKIVAIAEPRPGSLKFFVESHKLPEDKAFQSYDEMLEYSQKLIDEGGQRLADAVIIATPDKLHLDAVLKFSKQGFHILCEKPMATAPEHCIRIADAVKESGVIFGMGHVLRYSPYNKSIVDIIRSGDLGLLVNVVHVEPVGHQHFAHSYVRGNWSNESESCFSLMTKSCHDIDIICHYLTPAKPVKVSSFGSLTHFKRSAKPTGAGDATRCFDCPIEKECPYSAKRIYYEPAKHGFRGWPVSTITDGPPDIESVTVSLKEGPYGRCVYESDNDVVDHQVVNLQFDTGATCSFTMVAFTTLICDRQTRLHFTHGEIVGDFYTFTCTNFKYPEGHPSRTRIVKPEIEDSGHGGGDLGLIRSFVDAVRKNDQSILGTTVDEVLKSHLMVFAAEKSRKEDRMVGVEEFEAEIRISMA
ncbi:hypothetical protein FRC03_012233 [Tulasnella sp. 419]|nr:hypothetical protein FRC03_012233 [Tulasnella sp. 419]